VLRHRRLALPIPKRWPPCDVSALTLLPGDLVTAALTRIRRIVGALTALGIEPPPRLLSAAQTSALGWASLDPIGAQLAPRRFVEPTPRPLATVMP
jgi:hypothetical protein